MGGALPLSGYLGAAGLAGYASSRIVHSSRVDDRDAQMIPHRIQLEPGKWYSSKSAYSSN